jgi:hypothetical protein
MRATRWAGVAVVLAGAGWAVGRIARGPALVDIRAFDPDEVARLESAMWRAYYDRRRLELFRNLFALAAELYQVPAEHLGVHAERRAEAMTLRDRRALEPGGVTEADWERIEAVLRRSWRSLADELRAQPAR